MRKPAVLDISDIHIGSPVSRSFTLVAVIEAILEKWNIHTIIINGDLFNDLAFTRLTKEDWKLLSFLRKLSNPKNEVRIIWVRGNHDEPACEVVAHLLGMELVDEYGLNKVV